MKISELPGIRLANQNISGNKFKSVKELVSYMGAFQAQDYNMAKWGIGIRLENASEQMINESVDKGEILRTHLLRPTWHFVTAENIRWLLKLTSPQIKASMKSRNKQLELTPSVFNKSTNIISNALAGGKHLTRDEITLHLKKAKIKTDLNRASHLLMEAELEGIICSGKVSGNKITYALLEERSPGHELISKEESLLKLAKIYFKSRGPALVKDFAWWSGLSLTNAKTAVELIKKELAHLKLNKQIYWFFPPEKNVNSGKEVRLLPAYDEFLLSYADRSAILVAEIHKNVISSNGIFRPLIIVKNKVTGTWKRISKKDKVIIEMNFFDPLPSHLKNMIKEEAFRYGRFLQKDIDIIM